MCRDIEAYCHAHSASEFEYLDMIRRCAFNLEVNLSTGFDVVSDTDAQLAENTLAGRILAEATERERRFQAMLEEKYESLNDQTFTAIVRCRRCGCEEVTWEEKQTRSADEGATVFCSCTRCKNRWVMRQ